jgi:hypothetical protein
MFEPKQHLRVRKTTYISNPSRLNLHFPYKSTSYKLGQHFLIYVTIIQCTLINVLITLNKIEKEAFELKIKWRN